MIFLGASLAISYVFIMSPAAKYNVTREGYIVFAALGFYLFLRSFPTVGIYFSYVVEIENLYNWIEVLCHTIDSQDFVVNLYHYTIALKICEDLFSYTNFLYIFIISISVICGIYKAIVSGNTLSHKEGL